MTDIGFSIFGQDIGKFGLSGFLDKIDIISSINQLLVQRCNAKGACARALLLNLRDEVITGHIVIRLYG